MSDEQTPTKNYDALRVEFADWKMDFQRAGTQQEWARAHGLDPATVSQWNRHPDVLARTNKWRDDILNPAQVDVVHSMIREAKGGNVNAARLLGEWGGWEAPKQLDLAISEPFVKLQEQLIAIRKAALEQERQQPRAN